MRIGINVRDNVVKRIKELDSEINISQICREALTSYLDVLESANRIVMSEEDLNDIIAHLEESGYFDHPQVKPDWTGFAWKDARDWVRAIKPLGWRHFLDTYDRHKETSGDLYWHAAYCRDKGVKTLHDRLSENNEWFYYRAVIGGSIDRQKAYEEAENSYTQIFLAYVNEVRRKYLEHRANKNDNILAEREKEWQSRPEPELPPQLRD